MIDWKTIDTVLLDMDGTLLDLHFDNYFWQHHLPARYAEHHQIDPDEAIQELYRRFNEKQNSIHWYCTDYWSEQLALDIPALKREVQHLIAERSHVTEFLNHLGKCATERVLITNAHRHSLNLKLEVTGIGAHLDTLISSHDYGVPKEHQEFWHHLHQQIAFNPARTLFIDDTEAMLVAAQNYGIKHLLCVSQPDSTKAPRTDLTFTALSEFRDLLPKN
ncbi:MAG: GMP/IMP nucleotidase [Gammaproteobacteria bacterium]|nr:MAG: GMP/IMP nucleotidase [Gammaproteobacteria bacterium]RLA54873.1 MAG: GMP/IMP nucleotidase [Gammaproteobacteria bacterium]